MYSIRKTLNVSIITALIVVFSVTAAVLYAMIKTHVIEVYDTSLFDKSQALISLTELDEEGLEFDFAEDGVMTEFLGGESPQYYQLWLRGEQTLLKSPSLSGTDLPLLGTRPGSHQYRDLRLPDGRDGRLIEINFMPRVEFDEEEEEGDSADLPNPEPITLSFARERMSLDQTLQAIAFTIFMFIVTVSLLSAFLVWRLVGRGLTPLASLAQQVAEIDESRLQSRIRPGDQQSVEIAPIENQLNHLLERLQSAFEREKRFSSNVAHELRTPLSELRTLAEVGQMIPVEDRDRIDEFFADVSDISRQMEKVVTTLLELTRSEAGLLQNDPEDFELARFCDWVWRQAVNGQSRGKALLNQVPQDLVISTDREKLGMILNNLFVNAVSYSPGQAQIVISSEIRHGQIILSVKNQASDLKPEDVLHMKDRFWRKNKSRDGQSHSGLGLTLVDALARIMQLDVDLSLDRQQVFMVKINGLPLATQHDASGQNS